MIRIPIYLMNIPYARKRAASGRLSLTQENSFMKSMVLPSQAYEVKLASHPTPVFVFRSIGPDEVGRLRRHEGKLTGPIGALLGTK